MSPKNKHTADTSKTDVNRIISMYYPTTKKEIIARLNDMISSWEKMNEIEADLAHKYQGYHKGALQARTRCVTEFRELIDDIKSGEDAKQKTH